MLQVFTITGCPGAPQYPSAGTLSICVPVFKHVRFSITHMFYNYIEGVAMNIFHLNLAPLIVVNKNTLVDIISCASVIQFHETHIITWHIFYP